MKRIKKFVILLLVFILAGCKVNYSININSDYSVDEKVEATEETRRIKSLTGLDEKQAVNSLYESFNRSGIKTNLSYNTKDYDTIGTVTAYHDSIEDFVENFSSDIADLNITEDGDLVTLTFTQTQMLTDEFSYSPIYDEVEMTITMPFVIKEHNADSVSWGNYKWTIRKNDPERILFITFDKNNIKGEQKIKIGESTFNIQYQVIAFVVIGLVVIIIALVVFIKGKKNNRL